MKKHEHGTKEEKLESTLSKLRGAKLKITKPRLGILKILAGSHGPFTAEQIHTKLPKNVDLATVYRCLTNFESIGVVRKCIFGDSFARYEIMDEHHHHHIICRECDKITSLDDCDQIKIDRIAENHGFKKVYHSLEFFGICPECSAP